MRKIVSKSLAEAVEMVGGCSAMAKKIGISASSISMWLRGHQPISIERAKQIEKLTKKKFTVEMLMAHHKKLFGKKTNKKTSKTK